MPKLVEVVYPAMLDFPPPWLRAYRKETVVAEKLEALTVLGLLNSRFKDHYDLALLARLYPFEGALLVEAICSTFRYRSTGVEAAPAGLTDAFSSDPARAVRWRAFFAAFGHRNAWFQPTNRSLNKIGASVLLRGERMQAERWRRIESLFFEAIEKSPGDRKRYLDHVRSQDSTLHREIVSLLEHDFAARSFLESAACGDPAAQAACDPLPVGEPIGPYTVLGPLGAGGMGEVYKAHDQRLDRAVAIKFLSPRLADAESLLRFRREARAASSLNHPNICTVYDVGEFQGRPYIVMELLEGQSLKDRLADGPLPLEEIRSTARQVCAALQAAHEKQIVHRDIKPANIFLTRGGQVKVLDFGLVARSAGIAGNEPLPEVDPRNDSRSTAGAIAGTLAYMSPEQSVGDLVDFRSDIFSLGVVLYEMTTGRHPHRGDTPVGILGSILTESPRKPSEIRAGVPGKLNGVILKALDKDPGGRYGSAAELSEALDRCLGSGPAPVKAWIAAGIAAAIVVAGAASRTPGWFATESRVGPAPIQVTANPPEDPVMQAALSPDGTTVAYGDFSGIHLRRIGGPVTASFPPPDDYCFR